ncbi:hypothetical protein MPLB_1270003 [Mesorhizobium sp. ORS 3324]|nr:hypothetical protein MPLB_1270003 [Mesorhizobium sp. ORS 3324]
MPCRQVASKASRRIFRWRFRVLAQRFRKTNRITALSAALAWDFPEKPISGFRAHALDLISHPIRIPVGGGAGGRPGHRDDRRHGRRRAPRRHLWRGWRRSLRVPGADRRCRRRSRYAHPQA